MSSDRINSTSAKDASKWVKQNKVDCDPIESTPELCYPKSDVSPEVKKVLDTLFDYRKNRHDDKCDPTPKDPCVLSRDGLIKPNATPYVKLKQPEYYEIKNVEISINCYDIFPSTFTDGDVSSKLCYPSSLVDFDDYKSGSSISSPDYLKWQGLSGVTSSSNTDDTTSKVTVAAGSYVIYVEKTPNVAEADDENVKQAQGQVNYYALVEAVSKLDCKVSATAEVNCPEDAAGLLEEHPSKSSVALGTYVAYSYDRESPNKYESVVALNSFSSTDSQGLIIDPSRTYIQNLDTSALYSTVFKNCWNTKQLRSWYAAGTLVSSLVGDTAYSGLNCNYGNKSQTAYCVAPLYKGSDGNFYTNFATPRNAYINFNDFAASHSGNPLSKLSFFNNPDNALTGSWSGLNRANFIKNLRPSTYSTWNADQTKEDETLFPLSFSNTSSSVYVTGTDKDISSVTLEPVDPKNIEDSVSSPVTKSNVDRFTFTTTVIEDDVEQSVIVDQNINTFLHQKLDDTTKVSIGESSSAIDSKTYFSKAAVIINYDTSGFDPNEHNPDEYFKYTLPSIEVDSAIEDATDTAFNEAASQIDCEYSNSLVEMECPSGFTISEGVSGISEPAESVTSSSSYNTAQSIATNIVFSQLSGCMAMSGAVEAFCDYKTMVEKIMVEQEGYNTFALAQTYPWIIRADKIDKFQRQSGETEDFVWRDNDNNAYNGQKVYVYSRNYLIQYNGAIINNNIDRTTTTTVEYDTPFNYTHSLSGKTNPEPWDAVYNPTGIQYDHSGVADPTTGLIEGDSYPCEFVLVPMNEANNQSSSTQDYTIQYDKVNYSTGNCLVNESASQSSYIVPQGSFTKTSNGSISNNSENTQNLTVRAISLAISGLICQYGNSQIPEVGCKYKAYNDLDSSHITNLVLDGVEITRICYPNDAETGCGIKVRVGEAMLDRCSIGTIPGAIVENSYSTNTPYKSNKLAMSLYLAGRVCLPCDKVGSGQQGAVSININAGNCSCQNCNNAYCVFTEQ